MRRGLSVAVALLTAGVAWGQAGLGGPVPGGPGGAPPGFAPDGPGAGPVEKADPQVEAWVKTLTDKMNDPHDAIRDSARAGLVAVGSPALPALRSLAGGNDAKAFTARRLVAQIESGANAMRGAGHTGGVFPSQPGGLGIPGGFGVNPPPFGVPGGPGTIPGPGGRPGTEPGPGAPPPLRGVIDELKLNDRQQTQVEKTIEGYTTKLRGLLEGVRGGKIDRDELRDAAKKLADEATAEVNRILTPAQRETLERLTPRGRSLFPTPTQYGDAPSGRGDPNTPDRPRQPRPDDGR